MTGRLNWYSDHPPACTCARCTGTGHYRRRRDRGRRDSVRQPRQAGEYSTPSFRFGRLVRATVKLGAIAAVVIGVLWFLRTDEASVEVIDWVSSQMDAAATKAQELSDSMESRTSSSETRPVPTAITRSTSSEGRISTSVNETPRLPVQSSVSTEERPAEPSLRYPGEGPLDRDDVEKWIVRFTNAERERAGLSPFVHDPAISTIARAHSEKMVRFGLAHVIQGKDPTDRALDAGYDCRAFRGDGSYSYGLSENVAEHPRVTEWFGVGFVGGPTRWHPVEFDSDSHAMALGLVKGWMNSPGHRANILDRDARRIGVGVAVAEAPDNGWPHETVFATQNFPSAGSDSRASLCPGDLLRNLLVDLRLVRGREHGVDLLEDLSYWSHGAEQL